MKSIVRMRGLILGVAFFLIQAPAGADCPIPNPELEGPPITNPGGIVQPVRNDPGGHMTITLALEDPQDLQEKYVYYPRLTIVGDQEQGTPGVENGTFSHRWQGAANVVTYGVYV